MVQPCLGWRASLVHERGLANKVLEVLAARQLEEAVVAPSAVAPSPAPVALVAVAAMCLVGRGELAQVGAAAACSAAMREGTSMEGTSMVALRPARGLLGPAGRPAELALD